MEMSLPVEYRNPYLDIFDQHPKNWGEPQQLFEALERHPQRILDLGCGNGHFLENYLMSRDHWVAAGVDLRNKRLFKTAQKLRPFPNAAALKFDVRELMRLSPEKSWTEIWLQFPDPWPKDRHSKHRMVNEDLFRNIHRSLQEGGRFCFRSDCQRYWEELQAMNTRLQLFPVSRTAEEDLFQNEAPNTLFRNTFTRKGIRIYSVEFRALSSEE